ncbi:MAG: aminopeptidase P family N-terminal domain-containing protein [Granulosicoccaceae bacterium]
MAAPFTKDEYHQRLATVRAAMADQQLDALLVGDPANMNWLTGFDAWSFCVPQVMLVTHDAEPIWMGRAMDAGAVSLTTWLAESSVMPYPENCVQHAGTHPLAIVAGYLCDLGLQSMRIGYESDTLFFSPKSLQYLQRGVADAVWVDADLLVNWCRLVKSDAEVAMMRQAPVW